MKTIGFILLTLLSASLGVPGQESEKTSPFLPEETIEHRDCGLKFNRLHSLLQHSDKDALIIVLSHLGGGEGSKVGLRRLSNIKAYFTWDNLKHRRNPQFVLIAQGERAQAKGYLDFYMNGQLKLRIRFERNSDLHLGDCAPDPGDKLCDTPYERMFYPCRAS